jgi:hypothetical protein
LIEQRLLAASEDWFPETPALAERVRPRLPARPDRVGRVSRRTLAIALAAFALAGGALATSLLDVVPGVRLRHVERLPSVSLAQPLDAGRPVTLTEAARVVPFTLLLPRLEEPGQYFLDRDPAGRAVFTAVYGSGTRARLVLTQWSGGPVLFEKLLGYEARTEYVDVGGAPGIWIEGPEHAVFYLGLSGREQRLAGRLAGNVMVWQRNEVSYRLEADVGRERALELAASLRAK